MSNAQVETDPLFQLLTDALRAGPASAEWAQAVAKFRDGGSTEADEYKLLLQAREDLESGKEYKSVRAGTEFTRELLGKIEQEKEGRKSKGLPTATLIALGAAVIILGVIAVVGVWLSRGGNSFGGETLPTIFPATIVTSTFAPDDQGLVLTGDTTGGLKAGAQATIKRVIESRFEAEVNVQTPPGGSESSLVRLDVQGVQSAAKASWQLLGATQRVTVGEVTKQTGPIPADGQITLRLVVGDRVMAVYANKSLLWTGDHYLGDGARSVSISLTPAEGSKPTPVVKAIRIRSESSEKPAPEGIR